MQNISSKDKKIFKDMKQCAQDLGLKITDDQSDPGILTGVSTFEYHSYSMGIILSYDPSIKVTEVMMQYAELPAEKLPALYELINHINNHLKFNHFVINSKSRILMLLSGIYVTNNFLDKEEFKMLLGQDLGISHTFMPLVLKLIFTDKTPKSIMDEFYATKEILPLNFSTSDWKQETPKMAEDQPFILHGCSDKPVIPTHSHGMTKLGLPEFLINHQAFGVQQNGDLIGHSYKYFKKPENADKLDAIKNGETVRLKDEDLSANVKYPPFVYCYRRVYPEFEMVKQAYDLNDPADVDPKAWFVQIYVEGDDFALTDDYYKYGIK
jgi:hypothetical protein